MTGFSVDMPGINNQQVSCSPEYLYTSFMLLMSVFTLNMHCVRTVARDPKKALDLLELEF